MGNKSSKANRVRAALAFSKGSKPQVSNPAARADDGATAGPPLIANGPTGDHGSMLFSDSDRSVDGHPASAGIRRLQRLPLCDRQIPSRAKTYRSSLYLPASGVALVCSRLIPSFVHPTTPPMPLLSDDEPQTTPTHKRKKKKTAQRGSRLLNEARERRGLLIAAERPAVVEP